MSGEGAFAFSNSPRPAPARRGSFVCGPATFLKSTVFEKARWALLRATADPRFSTLKTLSHLLRSQNGAPRRVLRMRIGYARVSTNEQQPVSQTDALTEAGCERIYTETASGARRDRPELARALDVMREGDTLIVWKLDRLARSLGQLIETVRELDRRGIGFISLTDQIDTTSAGGRLLFHIMGAIAEFERDLIRERTRAGLNAARARGRVGARRRKLSAADIEAAKAMVRAGQMPAAAAERLGVSLATLYRYAPAIRDSVQK